MLCFSSPTRNDSSPPLFSISPTMFAAAILTSTILLLLISVSAAKPAAFSGHSYVLACGASVEASDTNGRTWSPDAKSAVISGESSAATADHQDPSLPSQVPYMTARVFNGGLNFTFSNLPPNRRLWVRLHFYPSSYLRLNPSTSFLSASAGHVTLLRNFSAAAAAVAHTQAYIVREFSILPSFAAGAGDFSLSLARGGSHGFVNGIEVVPAPEISGSGSGAGDFQTMFRLNVGGQYLPAARDPRLSRTWYDDTPYLLGVFSGVTVEAEKSLSGGRGREPPEHAAAPRSVYRTARSAGSETDAGENLTWVFEVDAGFAYLVRLHFCEVVPQVAIGDRVFDVLINDRTVEGSVDVVEWAHGVGIPVFKDFAVRVADKGNEAEAGLLVTLRSSPESVSRRGPILSGLEIFKVGGEDGNLAGLNPVPSKMRLAADADRLRKHSPAATKEMKGIAGGVASGAAGCAVVMTALFFAVHRNKRRKTGPAASSDWSLPLYSPVAPTRLLSGRSSTASITRFSTLGPHCRHFSLAEVRKGSDGFDESRVVGVGGFGKVYRGTLDINNGPTQVAMKRSNPSSGQGVNEFQTEIETLSKLRHKHLVSLVGFCVEDGEMILVYEYMANGTLREHLSATTDLGQDPDPDPVPGRDLISPLPWPKRVEICIGAARGLHYLHAGTNNAIIHRDVKSTNILLDENWVAKVSDFGLSKQGSSNVDQTHVSTMVKGSFGYLDPEYFRRQKLTDKSDVYSFGVVLFEVLCARPALIPNLSREQCSLADWVMFSKSRGTFDHIVDPSLREVIGSESFNKFVETAERCLADQGIDRPSMGEVLWNLEFALQLFENPELATASGEKRLNVINYSASSESGSTTTNSTAGDSNSLVVFSQLVNPRGR